MSYTFEAIFTERTYRETDDEWTGDIVYPPERKRFLSLKGAMRSYNYWRNNEKQAVKMHIKDEEGTIIAAFERNIDGDIVEDMLNV
jgi:hypothetical protein